MMPSASDEHGGVSIRPISADRPLRVHIRARAELNADTRRGVDDAWAALRSTNPRLYDGPVLLCDAQPDPDSNVLSAYLDTYRTLVAARPLGLKVRALGVQALITGRDRAGREYVLLARRGSETRIYAGLWENAPSGTIAPPDTPGPDGASSLTIDDFVRALHDEGVEELGIDLRTCIVRGTALLDDPIATSLDVVFEAPLAGVIDPRRLPCQESGACAWEYIDTAWVAVQDLARWRASQPGAMSPPTLALLRWRGWLDRDPPQRA